MRIHYFQHVPFENMGNIKRWAVSKNHYISGTLFFNNYSCPDPDSFDWLIIMGGPMSVYDEDKFPWLAEEKALISKAIEAGKTVLGICLGAQLIADVLGAKVYPNRHKEIGWFPVSLTPEARNSAAFNKLPADFTVFHWHGDTFDLPAGCRQMASSQACAHQAYEYAGGRVIGLQFHLESTFESVQMLIESCGNELVQDKYIQEENEILEGQKYLTGLSENLNVFLDGIEQSGSLS